MWLEAIVSREDFLVLSTELFPLSIRLGAPDSGHYVMLSEPTEVDLVPARGLRIRCNVKIRWPVLHIDLPIDVRGVTVLIEPSVPKGGGTLGFVLTLEQADVAFLPSMVDHGIVHAVNEALSKREELSWNFSETLTHDFSLPELLAPLHALGVEVLWGKVRTSEEATVLAVSFRALARRGDEPPRPVVIAPRSQTLPERFSDGPSAVFVAAATALAMTATYVIARALHRLVVGAG